MEISEQIKWLKNAIEYTQHVGFVNDKHFLESILASLRRLEAIENAGMPDDAHYPALPYVYKTDYDALRLYAERLTDTQDEWETIVKILHLEREVKDGKKGSEFLKDHLLALADKFNTVNQLYVEHKQLAERQALRVAELEDAGKKLSTAVDTFSVKLLERGIFITADLAEASNTFNNALKAGKA